MIFLLTDEHWYTLMDENFLHSRTLMPHEDLGSTANIDTDRIIHV